MQDAEQIRALRQFSVRIRMEALKSIAAIGIGHIGGTLSICDVLAVLYGGVMRVDPSNPSWQGRDYLVLSKGHAGPALYATLALKGFFAADLLTTLNQPRTNLPSHCDRLRTPGVDMTTGSLGQGASSAAGIALGLKRRGISNRVFLVLGDGECNEGQVWEMALFARQFKLDNLTAFVDYNKQQIDGFTSEICDLGDLAAKFAAFGWHAQAVDGHDVAAIGQAIEDARIEEGRPSVIVLNTVKGKGVSWWERDRNNHNMPITAEQLGRALQELEAQLAEY